MIEYLGNYVGLQDIREVVFDKFPPIETWRPLIVTGHVDDTSTGDILLAPNLNNATLIHFLNDVLEWPTDIGTPDYTPASHWVSFSRDARRNSPRICAKVAILIYNHINETLQW